MIEPIEPIAVAHSLRHREAEARVDERDSPAAGRNRDRAVEIDRPAVGRHRLDVRERRQGLGVRVSRIGYGDPAAQREPDAASRVGDERPVALHRVDREQAVGHAVLAHLALGHFTAEQRIAIDRNTRSIVFSHSDPDWSMARPKIDACKAAGIPRHGCK